MRICQSIQINLQDINLLHPQCSYLYNIYTSRQSINYSLHHNNTECYLRFCSEPFSIEKFNDSVHLCNFSIQKNYSISEYRDSNLPAENVWDNYTFQAYLETLGKM
ncbi:unnamed protein product, partial [Allacma fusca]